MTCIVAYKDKNKLYMGADGIAACPSTYQTVTIKHPKVFKKIFNTADGKSFENIEMLIGYTTSFRMGQILEYNFKVPNFIRKGDSRHTSNMEYMVKSFIPALIECFDEHIYGKKSDAEEMNGGTFLVCFNGSIFKVESDFSVIESTNNFAACGCGQDYAMGALHVLENDYDPENIVRESLIAASRFSGFVNNEITILSLKQ